MKTALSTTVFFLFTIITSTAQIQLGADIDGLHFRDQCGAELAISNSGDVFAVSSYFANTAGYDAGRVRVFNWNGTSWAQRGASLLGDSIDDAFGFSVGINANGTLLAVGVPYSEANRNVITRVKHGEIKVFEWNGSAWNVKGSPIPGAATNELFGLEIAINDAGNRIAASSTGRNSSKDEVRVFDWSGSAWVQVGNTLQGEANADNFGASVSFSGSGSILAVGAPGNKGTTSSTSVGHCRVFTLSGATWTQIGSDIDGELIPNLISPYSSANSGKSVALNESGNVVLIGAPVNSGNGNAAGHARVYRWNGTSWIQQGADIDGEAAGDFSGSEVSINAQGNIIAIGARKNGGTGVDAGHVRIFRWDGTSWLKQGIDIDGEGMFDESGTAVALDSMGVTVAIGAPENNNAGGLSGHARVYNLGNLVGVAEMKKESIITSISPNPFDREFIVSFKQPTKTKVIARDISGAIVYSNSIEGKSQLTVKLEVGSGIYFVEIGEGAAKEIHKVIRL
ncbi:MAG: hypothetical protein ACJARP_001766 [Vicingaceae bacterium]|jgi:hypothetical protein